MQNKMGFSPGVGGEHQFWNCFITEVMGFLSQGLRKLLFVSAVICVPLSATKHVQVGQIFFKDIDSNTINPAITTINVGDTVEWDWIGGTTGGTHSTTSTSSPLESSSPDRICDPPAYTTASFSYPSHRP